MRLRITGVETLEVVVPVGYRRKRKVIDPETLDRMRGRIFTTADLKSLFGYARNTALADTQLARHIEMVDDKKQVSITASRVRWRVI
jgi:hypothetical protein